MFSLLLDTGHKYSKLVCWLRLKWENSHPPTWIRPSSIQLRAELSFPAWWTSEDASTSSSQHQLLCNNPRNRKMLRTLVQTEQHGTSVEMSNSKRSGRTITPPTSRMVLTQKYILNDYQYYLTTFTWDLRKSVEISRVAAPPRWWTTIQPFKIIRQKYMDWCGMMSKNLILHGQ